MRSARLVGEGISWASDASGSRYRRRMSRSLLRFAVGATLLDVEGRRDGVFEVEWMREVCRATMRVEMTGVGESYGEVNTQASLTRHALEW